MLIWGVIILSQGEAIKRMPFVNAETEKVTQLVLQMQQQNLGGPGQHSH